MKIQLQRQTGFYGMGSPLFILVDGKKVGLLNHNETKSLELKNNQTLQISFYLLKSPIILIKGAKEYTMYRVTMNPILLQLYVASFLFILLMGRALKNPLISFLFILFYFIGFLYFKNRVYQIKEVKNG